MRKRDGGTNRNLDIMTNDLVNEMQLHFDSESAMLNWAKHFSEYLQAGCVIFLYGPLGAGKTTLTRGILRGLGFQDKVKSPTYTLVEPYHIKYIDIFHFDLYRLKKPQELLEIGIQDYLQPNAICIIEWPENGLPCLPQPDLACYISHTEPGRQLTLKAYSALGKQILEKLNKS